MENFFNTLSKLSQQLIIIPVSLLIYGYLSRILNLYFFWESKTIGWIILFIAIISASIDKMKANRIEKRNTLLQKIIIGISVFVLFIQCIGYIVLSKADSNKVAEKFILNDKSIREKVGTVKSIILIPVGGISVSSNSEGSEGQADYNFIVKGENEFMDLNLIMFKDLKTDWQIVEVND